MPSHTYLDFIGRVAAPIGGSNSVFFIAPCTYRENPFAWAPANNASNSMKLGAISGGKM